jgi:hypothetical protein
MEVWLFTCRGGFVEFVKSVVVFMVLVGIELDAIDEMLNALVVRILAPIGVVEFEHLHE